ncbi:GTPase [Prochlorothrix hollandica]|uniref:GTPase n=1 Tax=Prochlorothrix hollandica PCC 9006 = CALU 1027 TaxID=317619 RepID=A0A0M2PYG9_PROHO|nr:GTPase [Prochlorothrix hollandica]KKJ00128.1 hypothetical protein PROH_10385 [Prochlorothrix hollandica PCC 9006 = CALU 1027]
MVEHLHYPFLLLTHVICADGQIHSEEAKALHALANQIEINEATQAEVDKILSQELDCLSVREIAGKIPVNQQEETMRQVLAIAHVDGYYAPLEKQLVEEVCQVWNWSLGKVNNILKPATFQQFPGLSAKQKEEEPELSFAARVLKNEQKSPLSRALIGFIKDIAPETLGQTIKRVEREVLLSGPEYDEAIARCAKISREDYAFTESALQSSRKALERLEQDLGSILEKLRRSNQGKAKNGSAQEVAEQLEQSRKALTDEILRQLESLNASLKAKQRALNHFSIAFMGKTKAGKSTLHAIVTGEGWEAIGVGKQRTTRLNRVYEWKNIRIIDTPGIGAPGGKSDEEIARSVIDESDVICYVVTNDSIQETEFRFVNVLKAKAKPLIVLLNVKYNLRDSRRLEHFLKNQAKFIDNRRNGVLKGHLDRIADYAASQGVENYFSVIPAMLLAAQLSREPEHKAVADKLYAVSQVQDFLNSIRESLIYYGPIRRSQTLLGSTVGSIEAPKAWVNSQQQEYRRVILILEGKRSKFKDRIANAKEDGLRYFRTKVKKLFTDSKLRTSEFAEAHWQDKEDVLNRAWQAEPNSIKLNASIQQEYEEVSRRFKKEIESIINEIGGEMDLIFKLGGSSFKLNEQDSSTRWKNILTVAGAGIMLAGIGFALPVVVAIGGVIGVAAQFFKSKNTKRREAAAKIKEALTSQLERYEQQVLGSFDTDFNKHCKTVEADITKYFEILIASLKNIQGSLVSSEKSLDSLTMRLNKAYAKRVIDWCLDRYELLEDATIDREVISVKRDFGQQMTIHTRSEVSLQKSQADIESVLQEKFTLEY